MMSKTTFGEFGGEREDGVTYGAQEVWAVFSADEFGPPLATGRTEAGAIEEYAAERERLDPGEGAEYARDAIEHGSVLVIRCALAWAFDSVNDSEPTPDWLTGEAVAKAIAAERERAAAELATLTARMEAAIAEACAAVRARTIEECAARLDEERRRYDLLAAVAPAPARADCESYAFVVKVMAEKLRALATPTPAAEPAPVDPAARAL